MKRKLSALFLLAFLLAAHMPAPGRADTESNIQTIYTYLTENAGLNRAAACGILSNIKSESNFNPEAIGDSGNAYGICQWNSRRNSLISYCEKNGFESWKSLEGQLGYLQYELETKGYKKNVGDVLRALPDTAQGAFDAAWYFCVYFEIPADRYNKGNTRGANAVNIYWKKFGGATETYPMTYDANGGAGAPASGTKTEGVPFKITAKAPTRRGCEFLGWSEDKTATEPTLSAGDLFSENRAATFYAIWGQALPDDAEPAKTVTLNGRRYELFTGAHAYAYAKEYAGTRGGHLATIRTAAEANAILPLLKAADSPCWLGGEYACGNWTWASGESFSDAFAASYWQSGMPTEKNYASSNGRLAAAADGTWLDLAPSNMETAGFIVEHGTPDAEALPHYRLTVSTSLNLRAGPGTGYGKLGSVLKPDEIFIVHETVKGTSYSWGWGVTADGKKRGWAAMKIPDYMEPVSGPQLDEATGLIYELADGCAIVTGCSETSAFLSLPETLGGAPLTALRAGAFPAESALTRVFVPGCVTDIAEGAFAASISVSGHPGSAAHLAAVRDGLRFEAVPWPETLTLPANLTRVEAGAFENLSGVQCVDLSRTDIREIEANAFAGCESLRAILLPDTPLSIHESALGSLVDPVIVAAPGSPAARWADENAYVTVPPVGS